MPEGSQSPQRENRTSRRPPGISTPTARNLPALPLQTEASLHARMTRIGGNQAAENPRSILLLILFSLLLSLLLPSASELSHSPGPSPPKGPSGPEPPPAQSAERAFPMPSSLRDTPPLWSQRNCPSRPNHQGPALSYRARQNADSRGARSESPGSSHPVLHARSRIQTPPPPKRQAGMDQQPKRAEAEAVLPGRTREAWNTFGPSGTQRSPNRRKGRRKRGETRSA